MVIMPLPPWSSEICVDGPHFLLFPFSPSSLFFSFFLLHTTSTFPVPLFFSTPHSIHLSSSSLHFSSTQLHHLSPQGSRHLLSSLPFFNSSLALSHFSRSLVISQFPRSLVISHFSQFLVISHFSQSLGLFQSPALSSRSPISHGLLQSLTLQLCRLQSLTLQLCLSSSPTPHLRRSTCDLLLFRFVACDLPFSVSCELSLFNIASRDLPFLQPLAISHSSTLSLEISYNPPLSLDLRSLTLQIRRLRSPILSLLQALTLQHRLSRSPFSYSDLQSPISRLHLSRAGVFHSLLRYFHSSALSRAISHFPQYSTCEWLTNKLTIAYSSIPKRQPSIDSSSLTTSSSLWIHLLTPQNLATQNTVKSPSTPTHYATSHSQWRNQAPSAPRLHLALEPKAQQIITQSSRLLRPPE